jgi:tripartite-type tricarboxylate transporter receptor subunit TctC
MSGPRNVMLAAVLAGAIGAASAAQADYPDRPITLINPFPPGGLIDVVARPFAAELEQVLGQPVVMENRGGAAGAVGAQVAANAPADGYTLLAHIVSISIFPEVDRLFEREVNYEREDLVGVARLNADPPILIVHANTPWQTLEELIEDARARPNEIIFSSSGPYGALHLPMEMILQAAGVEMRHLPTTGGGPAMTAVLGENAQALVSGIGVAAPHIESGAVRPLAVFSAERVESFPDVPTVMESGYDIEYYMWAGLFAPAGTPDDALQVLRDAAREVATGESYAQMMRNAGLGVAYLDAPEFQEFWDSDAVAIGETVRAIGIVEY